VWDVDPGADVQAASESDVKRSAKNLEAEWPWIRYESAVSLAESSSSAVAAKGIRKIGRRHAIDNVDGT
jgi:hypothetical protein